MEDLLLKPRPQLSRSDETRTKAETSHKTSRQDSDPGYSVPVELAKDLWRMTLVSKSVHESHAGEKSVVSGGENTGENDGIDDTSSSFGACRLKDEGERRRAGFLGVEIGWEDVLKEKNAPKDVLDDFGDVLGGILGLTSRDGNTLSKRSSDKNRGKTTNAAHKRRTGQMPVFTTNVLPCGISTTVDYNAHDDEHDNRDHLEQTEPVLKLTVGSHRDDVDADEHDPENETQRPSWEVVGPVLEDELQSDKVRGCGDSVVEPVIPCNQNRGRTARSERLAGAEKETRADCASDGNHLHLARRQRPLQQIRLRGPAMALGLVVVVLDVVLRRLAHLLGVWC
ncbi:hypothetical protein HG530_007632 [Fusarium avenaceum]|nr:hypothetical protein HG530_007632 [Fusarium avenaceum]